MSLLKLADARFVVQDRYPLLEITINDRLVRVEVPRKPSIHAAGLVFLGSEFDDELPPQTIYPDGPEGNPYVLRGFSDDPRLFALVDRLGRAANDGTFVEGPVEIPA